MQFKYPVFIKVIMKHILILGVGNLLLSDDGFGVRVIEILHRDYVLPPQVELYDGGTGGLGLLPIIEKADYLIIIDTVLVGEPPGTIVKFNYENLPSGIVRKLSSHEIDIIETLNIAGNLGKRPPTVIIGIQPNDISSYGTKLSISEHIPRMIEIILDELQHLGIEISRNSKIS